MLLKCPLLAAAKRGRGEAESDDGGHGSGATEAEEPAGVVLGEAVVTAVHPELGTHPELAG
jgi:hypothetical protein